MTHDIVFESVRTVTQRQFAEWVAQRWSDLEHFELLNGRIVMTPPAGWPHGQGGSRLIGLLSQTIQVAGLGEVIAAEQGFALPSGDTVAPDCSVIVRARWEAAEPPVEGQFLRIVPDLVFEILSTSTATRDRGEKKAIYERNGVGEYWLIDLLARRLTRFTLDDGRYGLPDEAGEGETLTSKLVPELGLSIDALHP